MAVSTRTFSAIVSSAISAVQGATTALIDASTGSITKAYMQAVSAIALWLQGLALQIASLTRLSSSSGADVDSFLKDFGTARLGAVAAKGAVTFSRFTPTNQATIPAGSIVQTTDGTEQFAVIADTNQAAWNAGLNAYVIASNVSSCTATVQAVNLGVEGNVQAGLVTVLGQSILGVDTVTNASPFAGGIPAQSDSAARVAFQAYLENLTEGTIEACVNAALGVQTGLTCAAVENETYSGSAQAGYFYLVIDDGTGSPSSPLLASVYAAVDKVRAEGTMFGIFGPSVVTATIVMTVTVAAGFNSTTVAGLVGAKLSAFVNALGSGTSLPYTRLAQIAYDASAGVTNVTGVTLNSGTSDLTATAQQLIRAATPTVHTA